MSITDLLTTYTVFSTPGEYLLTAAVLMLAEGVAVLLGFGAGLIAVGTLAMVLPNVQDVVVVLLLCSLPPEAMVVHASRRLVVWREVALICVGIGVGAPLGTVVLKLAEPTLILTLLGGFLLLVGLAFLVLPEGRSVRWPGWVGPLVGLLGGVLAGMFGTGGPPLILYFSLAGMPKSAFRGHLMAIFMVITLVRLPAYAVGGLISVRRLWSAAAVLPAVLAGAWIGHRIHVELRERTFRRLVALALALIGVLLLGR